MPLETGDYICDLVSTNPPGTDNVSQGDDHLRLIKHILLTQFPNLCAAVTASADDLNNAGRSQQPIITTYTTPAAAQTHTFTAGRTWFKLWITGGGGGGERSIVGDASGGYGGGTAIKTDSINGATATYTLGAGGAIDSGDGGDSSFQQGVETPIIGGGGGGGNLANGPGTPLGGVSSGGDVNVRGGGGGSSNSQYGGASFWASGSALGGATTAATAPAYGVGGRGEAGNSGGDVYPPEEGHPGIIVIEEY